MEMEWNGMETPESENGLERITGARVSPPWKVGSKTGVISNSGGKLEAPDVCGDRNCWTV
jgi:hypothetical protein